MNECFIRIDGDKFGFVFNDEQSYDIKISKEEYEKYVDLTKKDIKFKVSKNPNGTKLFDLLEEDM